MKHYEKDLPQDYVSVFTIDAGKKKTGIALNAVGTAITAAILLLCYWMIRPTDFLGSYSPSANFLLVASLFAYIVLHELTHGAAYWLLTRQKLTFGMTTTVAFCGVPNVFVYRHTAMIALLAPFVLFTLIFGALMLALSEPWYQMMAALLLALHIGGCVGDLYDTWLYLNRFRNPKTLMRDTGPAQTFYLPRGE